MEADVTILERFGRPVGQLHLASRRGGPDNTLMVQLVAGRDPESSLTVDWAELVRSLLWLNRLDPPPPEAVEALAALSGGTAVAEPTADEQTSGGYRRCECRYDGRFWMPRPCREPAGHDGFHVDLFGRTWGTKHAARRSRG